MGSSPFGMLCFWLAMAFPGDFANKSVSRSPVSPFNPRARKTSLKIGVSWQIIDEMLAPEVETCRRCFPAQPALSALQRYKRRKCAFLLRDLAAAANLLPHGALFSQQLQDLTHRWWTERADTDIDIHDILLLAAAVHIEIKLHSERYPDPAPFQLPDLCSKPAL